MMHQDITTEVVDMLREAVCEEPLSDLGEFCDQVDWRAAKFLKKRVVGILERIAGERNHDFIAVNGEDFVYSGQRYRISVVPRVTSDTTLEVVVARRRSDECFEETREGPTVDIDGVGRFRKVQVCIASSLPQCQSELCEVAQTVFHGAYSFLGQCARQAFDAAERKVARDLYQLIRQLFRPEVSERMWLWSSRNDRLVWTVDVIQREIALGALRNADDIEARSLVEQLGRLLSAELSISRTYVFEALKAGRPLVGTFDSDELIVSGVGGGEREIFGGESPVVQCVTENTELLLGVIYPARLEREVAPILIANSDKFASIMQKGVKELSNSSVERYLSGDKLARLMGSFLGGLFGFPSVDGP